MTPMTGYIYPPPTNHAWDLGLIQPVIVLDQGQIPFWFGMFPPSTETFHGLLNMLGKTQEQVFPLVYESDVDLISGPIAGVLKGFSFSNKGKVDLVAI